MIGILLIIIGVLVVVIFILLISAFQKNGQAYDVQSFQWKINNLRNELYSKKQDLQRQLIQNQKLKDENRTLKESNNSSQNEVSSLSYKLSQNARVLSRCQTEVSNKNDIIQGLNFQCNELKDSLNAARVDADKADWAYIEMSEKIEDAENEIRRLNDYIESFENMINGKNPFDYVAHLRAHALEHVHEYVGKNVEEIAELFKYQYKFEYLLSIYPELRVYKNDDAYINYMHEEEKRCNIKNWLTEEEYNHLSEVGREQLAVDRYITSSSKWTDWEKGRNYEIYCAYILFNEGYDIIQEGLNKKLEDKGRDIIAVHQKTGKTLIVQCKNWIGYVRENIVFQLFGSYAQWLVDNDRKLGDKSVEAWLYVTGPLSDEAQRCAQKLDVHVRHLPMEKFPAIKCNVNHNTGQLIYHFPFDRHYDLVKINARGKGYKFSVAEAINEGFRRAYNH